MIIVAIIYIQPVFMCCGHKLTTAKVYETVSNKSQRPTVLHGVMLQDEQLLGFVLAAA
jgi:hypothetical protein